MLKIDQLIEYYIRKIFTKKNENSNCFLILYLAAPRPTFGHYTDEETVLLTYCEPLRFIFLA